MSQRSRSCVAAPWSYSLPRQHVGYATLSPRKRERGDAVKRAQALLAVTDDKTLTQAGEYAVLEKGSPNSSRALISGRRPTQSTTLERAFQTHIHMGSLHPFPFPSSLYFLFTPFINLYHLFPCSISLHFFCRFPDVEESQKGIQNSRTRRSLK